MHETPVHILEVRPAGTGSEASITLTVTATASHALLTALSEQLDRRRATPLESAGDVQALRSATDLAERFEELAAADAHAVVKLSGDELRSCLLELTGYSDRMDVEGFQPPELRERLELIGEIIPVLWDANAAASVPPLAGQLSD